MWPDEPEVRGLLALLLVTDARRATRTDTEGRLLLNRAVALSMVRGPGAALDEIEALERDFLTVRLAAATREASTPDLDLPAETH